MKVAIDFALTALAAVLLAVPAHAAGKWHVCVAVVTQDGAEEFCSPAMSKHDAQVSEKALKGAPGTDLLYDNVWSEPIDKKKQPPAPDQDGLPRNPTTQPLQERPGTQVL